MCSRKKKFLATPSVVERRNKSEVWEQKNCYDNFLKTKKHYQSLDQLYFIQMTLSRANLLLNAGLILLMNRFKSSN